MVKSMALHDSRSGRVTDCRRIALCFICLLLNVLFLTSLGAFSINVLLMATDFGSLMPIEILFLVTVIFSAAYVLLHQHSGRNRGVAVLAHRTAAQRTCVYLARIAIPLHVGVISLDLGLDKALWQNGNRLGWHRLRMACFIIAFIASCGLLGLTEKTRNPFEAGLTRISTKKMLLPLVRASHDSLSTSLASHPAMRLSVVPSATGRSLGLPVPMHAQSTLLNLEPVPSDPNGKPSNSLNKEPPPLFGSSAGSNNSQTNPPIEEFNHSKYLQNRLSTKTKGHRSRSISTLTSTASRKNQRCRSKSSATMFSTASSSTAFGWPVSKSRSSPLWEVSRAQDHDYPIPKLTPLPDFGNLEWKPEEQRRDRDPITVSRSFSSVSVLKAAAHEHPPRSSSKPRKTTYSSEADTICGQQDPERSKYPSNVSASSYYSSGSRISGPTSEAPRIPPKSMKRSRSSIVTGSDASFPPLPDVTYRNGPPAAQLVAQTTRPGLQSCKASLVRMGSATPTECERERRLKDELRRLDGVLGPVVENHTTFV